jgi:biotin carboxyl carrier protein
MVHEMPTYEIFIDNKPRKVELTKTSESSFEVKIDDKKLYVELQTSKTDVEKQFSIKMGDKSYKVELPEFDHEKSFPIKVEGASFEAEVKTPTIKKALATIESTLLTPSKKTLVQRQVAEGSVTAPMTGKIISVKVKEGDQVKSGQVLCIIEAMKMENEINAPKAGVVQEVNVSAGSSVSEGEVLFVIG